MAANFVESNPWFQQWGGEPDVGLSGSRSYVDADRNWVHVIDTDTSFRVAAFVGDWETNPDGAGERAAAWLSDLLNGDHNPATDDLSVGGES